ncbi:hypothetical protein L0152_23635 [bacterium]|nr:hypothetical protein [bacterium]
MSGTSEEARAIKTFFAEANILTGKYATETKLKLGLMRVSVHKICSGSNETSVGLFQRQADFETCITWLRVNRNAAAMSADDSVYGV